MAQLGKRSLWVALAAVALLASSASAAVVYKDVAELTTEAEQIVIGDVVQVTSFWDESRSLIKSQIVVRVDVYLVGSGPGVEVLEMSGGTVDGLALHVSVLPVFQPGDHVLLFLGNNAIRLVESHQGAYLTDGQQVVRMGPACVRVIESSLQPLSQMLAEIQRALPPGTTLPEVPPYTGDFRLPLGGSRYALCGFDWTYKPSPMGENYVINANCVDGSAGDPTSQRTQIQNGAAAWNNAGADFSFTYGGTSTQTSVVYNGTNLVYFDTTPPDGGGYVAATYIWYVGRNITECDLVFNDLNYTWWNGTGTCSGKMDIWDIATHELGHFLCLADLYNSGDSNKTMYGYVSYCETKKRTLDTDDINGIKAIYGLPDTTPPTPNPMTWAVVPAPTSTSAITMTATTATDTQSPPVQYYFNFVSGGGGGNDSAWQLGTVYTDSGLAANTGYTYRVKARDSATPTPNETAYSTNAATATWIETPTGVSFGTVGSNSIELNATGTFTNLTVGSSGVYFDSTTAGGDGGINAWVQVTTDTATGLSPNTLYTFQVKARNQNGAETTYSPTASKVTLANVPAAPVLSNVTQTALQLDVGPNGNPPSTEFAVLCNASVDPTWNGKYVDATGNPSAAAVWRTDAAWGNMTVQGLDPATQYCFQVKARNSDLIETAFSPQSCATTASPGLRGDMNCDGVVDFSDIDPFVEVLTGGACCDPTGYNCDVNGDGVVDFADIDPFVALLGGG